MMNDYRAISDTATSGPVDAPPKIRDMVQQTIGFQKESMQVISAISNFLFAVPYDSFPDADTKCLESGTLNISRNAELIMGALHEIAARLGVNGR